MYDNIQYHLKSVLDEERFEHTIGVMYTAGAMAMAHGYDIEKAMLAGLLHDCAKCMTHDERVALCNAQGVEITASEMENRSLLHAKAGAIVARLEYDITDKEILDSIASHTTGKPAMNTLEKIVYIADYIEPLRGNEEYRNKARLLAFTDLDACMAQCLYDTLEYLNSRSFGIDKTTAEAYNYYMKYRKEN